MKNPYLIIAVVLGVATLAYVACRDATATQAPSPPAGLAEQTRQLNQLVGDVANAADNLDHSLKANPPPGNTKRATDGEVAELLRIVGDLNRANAAQQETIRELSLAPKKEDAGTLDRTVTLVGLGSTILTMWLAWRKDRREIDELRAKLDELKIPGKAATP